MERMRRSTSVALLGVLLLATLAVAGCEVGPPTGPVRAGVLKESGDSIELVGYMGRGSDLGLAALYDVKQDAAAGRDDPFAILRAGSVDERGITVLDGRYVWVAGRKVPGDASTKVQEVSVDAIEVVEEP